MTIVAGNAAVAQNVRPFSTSTVGPWEAVLWARDTTVVRCTLARASNAPEGVQYGLLIDGEGILLGVAAKRLTFTSEAKVEVTLAPQSGTSRKLSSRPASNRRTNIELPKPVLDELQRSEHADLQIGAETFRLPFDDFNAARVVLEACVQKIGKDAR